MLVESIADRYVIKVIKLWKLEEAYSMHGEVEMLTKCLSGNYLLLKV